MIASNGTQSFVNRWSLLFAGLLVTSAVFVACGDSSSNGKSNSGGENNAADEYETIFETQEDKEIESLAVTSKDTVLLGLRFWDNDEEEYPGGVLRSTDGGQTFEHGLGGVGVFDLDIAEVNGEERIYAGVRIDESVGHQVYVSTDDGKTWDVVGEDQEIDYAEVIAADDDGYVYTLGKVSADGGQSWQEHALKDEYDVWGYQVWDMQVGPDGTVYVATEPGIQGNHDGAQYDDWGYLYYSKDNGSSWNTFVPYQDDLSEEYSPAYPSAVGFAADGAALLGTSNGSVYRSEDGGDSWNRVVLSDDTIENPDADGRYDHVDCFATAPSGEIAAGYAIGFIISDDDGRSWEPDNYDSIMGDKRCDVDSSETYYSVTGTYSDKVIRMEMD
jgi:hypothetical protein